MEKITVLLVEDEQTLAMIIKDTLEGQNFIIHTAADGEEGLRKFFDLRPDVLVADVMMPRMDGFEMVRRIRQTDKQTPVLFLTARSTINDVVEGFELGANDYLKKPFGMQELIIRIKALVGKAFSFTEEKPKETTVFEIGDYRFNSVTQRLAFAGSTPTSPNADTEVELSHRESEILKRLARTVTRWSTPRMYCSTSGETTASSTPAACMCSSPNCGINWPETSASVSSMCGE